MNIYLTIIYSEPNFTTLSWFLQHTAILANYCQLDDEIIPAAGYVLANTQHLSANLHNFLLTEAAQGKLILGIGSGATSLVNAGLIPGLAYNKTVSALTTTIINNPINKAHDIQLSPDYQYNAFTRNLHYTDKLSVTHAATFVLPPALEIEVIAQGLNILQYSTDNNIAALANKNGNVMALLPELNATPTNAALFSSMRDHIKSGYQANTHPLAYWPR
jgi:phosphoribosylformylglycinamidine synthase